MQLASSHPVQPTSTQMGAVLADPQLAQTKQLYDSIRGLVNRHPHAEKLREALAVALTYDTEKGRQMHGATMHDPFADTQRPGMPHESDPHVLHVSPFHQPSAGATAAITYAVPETQDVYVLLARKLKDPQHPEMGLSDQYILPGGYMAPHPANEPNFQGPYDRDLHDTLLREVREETSLQLPSDYKFTWLGTNSRHGVSNDARNHTVSAYGHINMTGPLDKMPKLQAGDDVAELTWVNAKEFEYHPNTPPQPHSSLISRYHVNLGGKHMPVRDDMAEMLDKAVALARRTLLEERRKQHGSPTPQAAIPATAFGPQAHVLHLEEAAYLDKSLAQSAPPSQGWQTRLAQQQAAATAAGRVH